MAKIYIENTVYSREFRWRDDPHAGFSFDCAEDGTVAPLNPDAAANLARCLSGEYAVLDLGVRRWDTRGAIDVCGRCYDELSGAGLSDTQIADRAPASEDRYAAGCYAGHYCDRHWQASGYRDDLPSLVGGMSEDEIEAWDYRDE